MTASCLNAPDTKPPGRARVDGYLLAVTLNLFAVLILIGAIVFLISQAVGPGQIPELDRAATRPATQASP